VLQIRSLFGGVEASADTSRPGTAQLLLTKGAQTRTLTSLTPWIIGGLVLVVALIVIGRMKN
jgi:hypothetical protein